MRWRLLSASLKGTLPTLIL